LLTKKQQPAIFVCALTHACLVMPDTRTPYQRYSNFCRTVDVKPMPENLWDVFSGTHQPLLEGYHNAASAAASRVADSELHKATLARRKMERASAVPIQATAEKA
jgi:hypothetical protein